MNKLQFALLTKLKTKMEEPLDSQLVDEIYEFYKTNSLISKQNISISREEMNEFFSVLHQVLSLSITDLEFVTVSKQFLTQIIIDAMAENGVDLNWLVNHLWYYRFVGREITEKYLDSISLAQEMLVKKLNMQEKITQKIKRKYTTRAFIKL